MGIGLIENRTMNEDIGARCGNCLADIGRRRLRHDDRDRHTERPAGISRCNAGIAAGSAEDLARAIFHLVLAKPADAAQLEAAGRLQRIKLQPERFAAGAIARCCLNQGRVEMERYERHGEPSREIKVGAAFLIRLRAQEQSSLLRAKRTDSPLLSLEMPISGV